jgi:hypothetical protein
MSCVPRRPAAGEPVEERQLGADSRLPGHEVSLCEGTTRTAEAATQLGIID